VFVKLTSGRAGFALTLSGALDGPVPWPSYDRLADNARGGFVVVDVGAVVDPSPAGFVWLLRGLQSAPARDRVLVNVRPSLLALIALTPGASDAVRVGSAHLPFVCPSCRLQQEHLVDVRRHDVALRQLALPSFACTACGASCAFDDDAASLLAPFAEQAPLAANEDVDAYWPPPRAAALARITVELDVDVDVGVTAAWLSGSLVRTPTLLRVVPQTKGLLLIADGIHATTPAGLDALRELCTTVQGLWLARMSPVLAQGMATTLDGYGHARVASLRLPFRCPACVATVLVDVDVDVRAGIGRGVPPTCLRCATELEAAFSDREVMSLQTLPLAVPPPAIAAYLQAHGHAPSADRQSQWTQVVVSEPATAAPAPPAAKTPSSTSTPATPATPSTPSSSATRYEVVRRLGVGGMAETLLGRQLGIGGFEKRVVIKRILPALLQKPQFVDMFLHEARVAARINHSNVVQIFDFGRAKNEYFIVMEYVKGYDLSTLLKESQRAHRPFPIELAIRIVCDLCAGLSAAHTARNDKGEVDPIVHRDVSPHNVLVSSDGATKLADFGIAKPLSMAGNTKPGELRGKIVYMAPEALRNEPPTTKLDIYAAGLILYTLLAGKNPYARPSEVQSMYAVAHEGLPPIITARRDVPFSLAATLGRAVNRDPGARFPTAQALQLHLEAFLGELGRPATPMHVALWANELMAQAEAPAQNAEGTPSSSSLEMIEFGSLTHGSGNVGDLGDLSGQSFHITGMLSDDEEF
jgi:serine/threonine protein kinase